MTTVIRMTPRQQRRYVHRDWRRDLGPPRMGPLQRAAVFVSVMYLVTLALGLWLA